MPSSQGTLSTPEGSPSHHILVSPPPSPPPLRASRHRPRFETKVLPRTTTVDAVEVKLTPALVTMIGGTRPLVTTCQVLAYLNLFYVVSVQEVQV
jgi:hypothetical protein